MFLVKIPKAPIFNYTRILKRKLSNIKENFILKSEKENLTIPNVTLHEYLGNFHDKFEHFVAIECADSKKKVTYGDIRDKSTYLSRALRKIFDLKHGDVIAIILNNIPEYPIVDFGILKANLTVTTVSPAFTPNEISRQLIDSNTKIVITETNLYKSVKESFGISKKDLPVIVIKSHKDSALPENTINYEELIIKNDYQSIIPCDSNEIALLPYSSGTTGIPKGVELTHKNLVANIMQSRICDAEFQENASESYQEILPTILPFYHSFGQALLNGLSLVGGKMITLPNFSQDDFISILANNKSTLLYLVPPLVLMLIHNEKIKRDYLKNVKMIISGGAPLAAFDEIKFLEKFGDIPITQGYGLTEASPVVTSLYPSIMKNLENSKGSVGKPLPNTLIKIVYDNNEALGPNSTGEILIKGPQVMKGYHNLPEETDKVIQENWLRTGDLGYFNKDGYLFITDRLKELIKVKGNQVAPAELEGIIRMYPNISDVAVIGIPHEFYGEIPRAYIVVDDNIDLNQLNNFINSKVAKYKQLKGGIAIVENIPKNSSGKILRREIKENYLTNEMGQI